MPTRLEVQLNSGPRPSTGPTRRRDEAMRLLLIGDFSARLAHAAQPAVDLAARATHRVDSDNFDDVLRRLAPAITVTVAGEDCEFRPGALDDFHPDRLLALLPPLARADALRRAPTGAAGAGDDDVRRLLGVAPPVVAAAQPAAPAGIDALLHGIVAPHVVPGPSPRLAAVAAGAEAALTEGLRGVLHAPAFQALESAWRGAHWLVSHLELDESLQLHLFDLSRAELLADVAGAAGRIEQTGVARALVDRWRNQPGGQGWSALVALYEFGPSDIDIGLLAALGVLASQAGGPVLAGAAPALSSKCGLTTLPDPHGGQAGRSPALGAVSTDTGPAQDGWQALRRSEVAPWIGLVAARLLLRLPYGRGYEGVDAFSFEEFAGAPAHEQFLWGCGALAPAWLLGRAFAAGGWQMALEQEREVAGLPAYTTVLPDGERELQACAEHYHGEQEITALLAAGLMPLASHRLRNAVDLVRWQSIAEPASGLAGLAGLAGPRDA